MKNQAADSVLSNEPLRKAASAGKRDFLRQARGVMARSLTHPGLTERMEMLSQRSQQFLEEVRAIGLNRTMDELDRGKLSIFNQLNFFQVFSGLLIPLVIFFNSAKFPVGALFVSILPAFVSMLVLYLNFYYRYELGMMVYFVLYPLVTSVVYMNGMDLGVGLFFILYGVLAVFFLQNLSQMIFCIGLSMVSYFILAVVSKQYPFQLESTNFFFYLFNQLTAIGFIFYGLYLIKKESNLYQLGILATNQALQEQNAKIEKQKAEIEAKARELAELNALKNKLFSVISHDLKTPMYALRNLFTTIQQQEMAADELREMLPDVVADLNHTTGLMENLLLWARSQMNASSVNPQPVDIAGLIVEAVNVQHLQAASKRIGIHLSMAENATACCDRDMINLVLRNLLSNAIKFTGEGGDIRISAEEKEGICIVSVEDNGVGMAADDLRRINENGYYTTTGTSGEQGTGLGLMLCKEFLVKNGGQLNVRSEPGRGSCFTFKIPCC